VAVGHQRFGGPYCLHFMNSIHILRLTLYVDANIGEYQCGFRRHVSNTDQILCIRHILEKQWECNGTVDHEKAYD
jgi:hypothetical protein